uniref:Uncharacterized protein n=1 Tax=Schistocephalus solidus TaxID=70667 RepID=A0A0X3NFH9_SCHSO
MVDASQVYSITRRSPSVWKSSEMTVELSFLCTPATGQVGDALDKHEDKIMAWHMVIGLRRVRIPHEKFNAPGRKIMQCQSLAPILVLGGLPGREVGEGRQ